MVYLDALREEIGTWLQTLYVEENGCGGYRMGKNGKVNLLSTTDAAWILYAINNLESVNEHQKEAWAKWLLEAQDKKDGHYSYTDAVGEGNMHSNGHAFWHTNRALGILNKEISIFPEYLRSAMTVIGLNRWFQEWENQANATHHDVLGLIPLLANTKNQDWIECFYNNISFQQNQETGTWPRNTQTPNISRTFAYTVIYRAANRIPPQPQKIVNAILSLQSTDGLWHDRNHSYFSTMDSIYILVRLPNLIDYKKEKAIEALKKAFNAVTKIYNTEKDTLMENTHAMLAVAHALGLLCEVFPEKFDYSKNWQFDWENLSLFRCSLLQNAIP